MGINTTTPYDSQWGTDGNNTELAIEGGSTGYGVIHLRGTGAGSTDTRFSMGVGDTKFYMAYDRIDGAHRMTMNTDGAIGFSTSDVGDETLTITKVGSSSYGSIQLRRSDSNNTSNGGILNFAQKDDASTSWLGLAGWDNGTDRTIYLGGGNWGVEEATAVVLFAGSYDAGSGGASEAARFSSTFNSFNRPTTIGTSTNISGTHQLALYRSANPYIAFYSGSTTSRGGYLQYLPDYFTGGSYSQSAGSFRAPFSTTVTTHLTVNPASTY